MQDFNLIWHVRLNTKKLRLNEKEEVETDTRGKYSALGLLMIIWSQTVEQQKNVCSKHSAKRLHALASTLNPKVL